MMKWGWLQVVENRGTENETTWKSLKDHVSIREDPNELLNEKIQREQ